MTNFTPLCQLNGGCMGCCGHDFGSVEQIKEATTKSTKQFNGLNPKSRKEFISFKERYHVNNLNHGVCRNLIQEKGCFTCPLHPARHKGDDLRINHCDVSHLCDTAKEFEKWHKSKQEKFIEFIEKKELNNVEYSLMMDNGNLMKEFKCH
jgi:hypothetical protein